jgi:hypothetical protein
LFCGEEVSTTGTHYTVSKAALHPPPARKTRVVLAAGGRQMIELAAAEADTVVFSAHTAGHLSQLQKWLKAAAGQRFPEIELALRFRIAAPGAAPINPLETPHTLPSSPEDAMTHLYQVRERFGISYIVIADHDAEVLAPTVSQLTGK